jgi:hypothetical protein
MFRYEQLSRRIGKNEQNCCQGRSFMSEAVNFMACLQMGRCTAVAPVRANPMQRKARRGKSKKVKKFE